MFYWIVLQWLRMCRLIDADVLSQVFGSTASRQLTRERPYRYVISYSTPLRGSDSPRKKRATYFASHRRASILDTRLRVKLTRQIPASCRRAFCPDCTSYSRA